MEGAENTQNEGVTQAPQVPTSTLKNKFPGILSWILSAFAFLMPIFAIPNVAVSLDASKSWLLVATVFASGLLVLLYLLLRGEMSVPKSFTLYAVKGVVVATALSAFLSPQKTLSLIGSGAQIGTLSTIALLFLLTLFATQAFRERSSIFRFILAIFAGFSVLSIFHVLRLAFGSTLFSFGVFQSPVFSLVGKWNDFAVFAGLILILSMVAEYYFKQSTKVLWASRAFAVVSAFFLLMIDFWILWLIIAIVAALFILRSLMDSSAGMDGAPKKTFSFKNLSYLALIIVVLGLSFGYLFRFPMGASTISQKIVTLISPQPYAEIVLPPSLSMDITKGVWGEGTRQAVFGVGANRFSNAYFMHKPQGINNTPLWDSSFESGFSHITTFFTTTGILGTLAWILLLLAILLAVFRTLKSTQSGVKAYLGQSVALATLYLFSIMAFYLPNIAIVALAFLFLGALAGILSAEGNGKVMRLGLPNTKGWGVAMVPLVVLLALGLSVWSFDVVRALRSESAYQEARTLANQGNVREAFSAVARAEKLGERDAHYRLETDLHLLELQRILAEAPSSPEALQAKVRELAQSASGAADKAIALDPTNYLNYVSKASVGDVFATLNIDRVTTATIAKEAYIQALQRNPSSPRIEFATGRAELLLANREGAKLHLGKARDLRPAYPEAIAALAELSRQDGDMGKAIDIATAGLQSDPSNFIISFQLGFLYYANQDYDRAIAALENAVAINPYYADAKYFLGISYARKGNKEKALKQFEDVRTLNADNAEIGRVIKNLSAGRDPLADQ